MNQTIKNLSSTQFSNKVNFWFKINSFDALTKFNEFTMKSNSRLLDQFIVRHIIIWIASPTRTFATN